MPYQPEDSTRPLHTPLVRAGARHAAAESTASGSGQGVRTGRPSGSQAGSGSHASSGTSAYGSHGAQGSHGTSSARGAYGADRSYGSQVGYRAGGSHGAQGSSASHGAGTSYDTRRAHASHAAQSSGASRPSHAAHTAPAASHERSSRSTPYGSHAARPSSHSSRPNPYVDDYDTRDYDTRDYGSRQERVQAARAARRRRKVVTAAAIGLAVVLAIVGVARLSRSQTPTPVAGAGSTQTPTVAEPTQPTEAELRIEEVRARASANCTREQPSGLTDPADYAELGRATMEAVVAACGSWEGFDNADSFSLDGRYAYNGEVAPYLLAVNRAANVVTAYALDADGRYTVPYLAMICSTGTYTPIGFYTTSDKYDWLPLFQEVYGQYATRIIDTILFHSVPYYNPNMDDLEYEEYNLLGTAASLGCVRLQVCDVKWIYDNCPSGTPVVIYDDADNPGPMGRPGTIATNVDDTDTTSATYRGFDPTDPNALNPWDPAFRSGTAIRSEAAQAEWDDAQADDRWLDTVNPANLLGYSTDADSRG